MRKKGKGNRLLAMLMAISILIGNMPPFTEMTRVHAEPEDVAEKTVTGLGTACISGPSIPSDATAPWKGSYVYFGMYDPDTEDEEEAYPVKYRVLSANTARFSGESRKHTMFLDCDTILYRVRFDNNGGANPGAQKANEWAFSDLRSSLNKGETSFLYRGFSAAERGAIAESTIAAHPLKSSVSYDEVNGDELLCDEIGADEADVPYQIKIDYADYVALSEDRIFVLDAEDAVNPLYGYFSTHYNTQTRIKSHEKAGADVIYWWLRSAGTHERLFQGVGSVQSHGQFSWLDSQCPNAGASPALNIDLSCVVFSSRIPSESEAGNTYKLTISDNDLKIAASDVTSDGDNVTLSYTISDDSEWSEPTQVSLVVTDGTWTENGWSEGARLIAYEKISDVDETGAEISGTGTFTLNSEWNDAYHYYIVAEDVKGALETDLSSQPVEISFSKCSQIVNAPAAAAGLKYNGAAQKLVSPAVVVKGNKAPGSIEYSLDNKSWSSEIPTGVNAGDYSIYWRVAGNCGFNAFVSDRPVNAGITEADPVTPPGPDDKDVVTPGPDDKDVVSPVPDDKDKDKTLPDDKSGDAMNPVPRVDHEAAYQWIYLVKGQKFTDAMFAGWTVDDANKKNISISKKGVVSAKKATQKAELTSPDKTKVVSVNICQPSLDKKLKLEAGESGNIVLRDKNEKLAVLWGSSNPDVACVDINGHVSAIAKGKAVITAYINGRTYKCSVTVKETSAARSRVVHLNIGETKKISLKGVKKYKWTVSGNGPDIIEFKKGNKIRGKAAGVVSLNAVDPKTDKEYTATVCVEDITVLTDGAEGGRKNRYTLRMKAGETKEIRFANVAQPVIFRSSKPEYAYATGSGVISAEKKGKAKLTAKINGKTVTINVVVE